jgi:hypothetical protein
MNAKLKRNPTGTCICHCPWNRQWCDAWIFFPVKPLIPFFFGKLTPNAASCNHRGAVSELAIERQTALSHRFASRYCSELGKALQHDQVFVAEMIGWIESPRFSTVLELVWRVAGFP